MIEVAVAERTEMVAADGTVWNLFPETVPPLGARVLWWLRLGVMRVGSVSADGRILMEDVGEQCFETGLVKGWVLAPAVPVVPVAEGGAGV